METWNAITSRRNVRHYSDEPLPAADLDRILEAARRAPSAMNSQWWDLVVVTDRAELEALAKVWSGAGHVARSQATVAVVAPSGADDQQREMIQYDLGQMTIQMMIAAADLGIGTAHAAVQDQELARRLLGFPDDRICAWLVAMGYPAEGPLRPIENLKRRDFDNVVHRGRW
jgi:nitroreductase